MLVAQNSKTSRLGKMSCSKLSGFLATSLKRVPLTWARDHVAQPFSWSPERTARTKPETRFCNSRLDEIDSLGRDLQSSLSVTHAIYPKQCQTKPKKYTTKHSINTNEMKWQAELITMLSKHLNNQIRIYNHQITWNIKTLIPQHIMHT